MNIRKKIDYSDMHTAIDAAMSTEMPQMELYFTLGRLVSNRPEKVRLSPLPNTWRVGILMPLASPRATFAECGISIGCMRKPRNC